jgi:hypothetical protein
MKIKTLLTYFQEHEILFWSGISGDRLVQQPENHPNHYETNFKISNLRGLPGVCPSADLTMLHNSEDWINK